MSKLFERSLTYKPFHFPWAVDITKTHERVHWIEEEADLSDDVRDWKSDALTDQERHFITQVLRLFTQSDVEVGGMYFDSLIPRFVNNEVRNMLGSFATREGVHQRAYALLIDTLGLPDSEFHAFMDYAEMKEKAEHMTDVDSTTDRGLLLALAQGVFNEGVSLFASFAMLLNFQRQGKMKGMGKVVEWSQRDESIHVEGVTALFRTLADERPDLVTDDLKRDIYDRARETVRLEDAFIDLAFEQGGIQGITAAEVKDYIRFVSDRRLMQLGLKPNWNIEKNPLAWVDYIVAGVDHTNFFEGKSTDYEVASLQGEWGYDAVGDKPERSFLVYTRDGCGHCTRAKVMLEDRAIHYDVADLTDNALRDAFFARHAFTAKTGPYGNTMPKVFERVWVGGRLSLSLVGGADDLDAMFKREEQGA